MGSPFEIASSKPLFKPHSWLAEASGNESYAFLGTVQDIASGSAIVLEMVEKNDIAKDSGDTPLFSPYHSGALMRLAISALHLLQGEAEAQIESRNKAIHAKGAD